jgi:hypothetical protein
MTKLSISRFLLFPRTLRPRRRLNSNLPLSAESRSGGAKRNSLGAYVGGSYGSGAEPPPVRNLLHFRSDAGFSKLSSFSRVWFENLNCHPVTLTLSKLFNRMPFENRRLPWLEHSAPRVSLIPSRVSFNTSIPLLTRAIDPASSQSVGTLRRTITSTRLCP